MARATWNGTLLAESDHVEVVEGNLYFPPDSIRQQHFEASDTQTVCPWKGTASYYHLRVDDEVNRDAAWYYPEPRAAAVQIKGHVAFWKGVDVEG